MRKPTGGFEKRLNSGCGMQEKKWRGLRSVNLEVPFRRLLLNTYDESRPGVGLEDE